MSFFSWAVFGKGGGSASKGAKLASKSIKLARKSAKPTSKIEISKLKHKTFKY